jgi:CubicO group peptidase (beta-lactamase class C family)
MNHRIFAVVLLGFIGHEACLSQIATDVKAPGRTSIQYFPPPEAQGGWRSLVPANMSATPEQKAAIQEHTGLDWDKLLEAWTYCSSFSGSHSLLVIRHGWIAAEWHNFTQPRGIASCTKSITGLAVARLLDMSDQGLLKKKIGLDDFVYQYLPASWSQDEPARQKIQLRHLLTMTSGLMPYDGPYKDDYESQVFAQRVEAPPGTVWAYASVPVDLLSYVIEDVTGRSLGDFFNDEIGSAIGASPVTFPAFSGHSGGSGGPGGGARFTARELARVGYLLLHRGIWQRNGLARQVISAERVTQFTQWSPLLENTTWRQPNFAFEPHANRYYGQLFWTNRTQEGLGPAAPRDAFYMSGWGKQICAVIPSLDMVVVRLGSNRTLNDHPEFYHELFSRIMAAKADPPEAAIDLKHDKDGPTLVPSWIAKAPPLPPPQAEVIRVATADELFAAAERLGPGGTILLADGHYKLPRVLVLQGKQGVTIRSAGGDPDKVSLSGRGWDSDAKGDDILHIGRCEGVTIADLTFTDCRSYGIKIEAENAPRDIHIYNCRFRDIGVRAIKGSAGQDPNVHAVKGSVRYCRFENTKVPPAEWLFGGDYIAAIDMMALEDWTFSDNIFQNVKGRNGGGRAAIFIWVRSERVVVERNLIVNCDRGIAFGNPGQSTANLAGEPLVYVRDGIIRNNFIVGGPDCGIELWYAQRVKVCNNSIWRPQRNWARGIRIGTGTSDTDIVNNLVHGDIRLDGGQAQLRQNLAGRLDGYFVDATSGNLALTPAATGAIDQGVSLPEVTDDIRRRPRTGRPDLGAWEFDNELPLRVTAAVADPRATGSRTSAAPDAPDAMAAGPIRLHPDNPHYFCFRGRPAILITAGEHYGAVMNLDFDYVRYLDELHTSQFNLTRIFSGIYREVPGSFGIIGNTLAPAEGRFVCPWARSRTPGASDGGCKFDLTMWDEAYFDRLKDFVAQAGRRGIVVELVLFCTMYDDNIWNASPMNDRNNINSIGDLARNEVYNGRDKNLLAAQEAVVRKLVTALNQFDNLYYEVCNEPYERGGLTKEWNDRIIAAIVETEASLPRNHLIAQGFPPASSAVSDISPHVSILNFHAAKPDAVRLNYHLNRVIAFDETGGGDRSDSKYRTEGWEFILAGGGVYDHLDFSFTPEHEDGTAVPLPPGTPGGGGPELRRQLRILKEFVEGFALVRMAPDNTIIKESRITGSTAGGSGAVSNGTARALVAPGEAYAVYVHGGTRAELVLELPAGAYKAEWVNTKTGRIDKTETSVHAGGQWTLVSPTYSEDIALRVTRQESAR